MQKREGARAFLAGAHRGHVLRGRDVVARLQDRDVIERERAPDRLGG